MIFQQLSDTLLSHPMRFLWCLMMKLFRRPERKYVTPTICAFLVYFWGLFFCNFMIVDVYLCFQVKNDKVHFVWTQFSELNSYFKKEAEDMDKVNAKLAEMLSLLTCNEKSTTPKGIKFSVTSELKDILTRMDARIRSLYNELPTNAMLIICTGHGDTAIVHRYIFNNPTLFH